MTDIHAYEVRRRRREFIRAYHPDRGGDPEVFVTGLRAFDAGHEPDTGPLPRVVIIRRRPWLIRQAAGVARRLRHSPRPSRVH